MKYRKQQNGLRLCRHAGYTAMACLTLALATQSSSAATLTTTVSVSPLRSSSHSYVQLLPTDDGKNWWRADSPTPGAVGEFEHDSKNKKEPTKTSEQPNTLTLTSIRLGDTQDVRF